MRLIIVLLLLCFSVGSYLYYSTAIFYKKVSLDPIKLYFSVAQGEKINLKIGIAGQEQLSYGTRQRHTIKYVRFGINVPFEASIKNEFQIGFKDFSKEINFWDDIGKGEQKYNRARVDEYVRDNRPDYLLDASFIKEQGGRVPIWSQVWQSQPVIFVESEPFLKETSYGVWEAMYFFDTKFSGTNLNQETYLAADVDKLFFEVKVPHYYDIQNIDDIKLDKIEGGYLINKELEKGKTFHLVLKDKRKDLIKIIIAFLSPALFGVILGILIDRYLLSK